MLPIAIFAFATAAGVTLVLVLTVLVMVGVRQEERRLTLTRDTPPSVPALLARHVLGARYRSPCRGHRADSSRT